MDVLWGTFEYLGIQMMPRHSAVLDYVIEYFKGEDLFVNKAFLLHSKFVFFDKKTIKFCTGFINILKTHSVSTD